MKQICRYFLHSLPSCFKDLQVSLRYGTNHVSSFCRTKCRTKITMLQQMMMDRFQDPDNSLSRTETFLDIHNYTPYLVINYIIAKQLENQRSISTVTTPALSLPSITANSTSFTSEKALEVWNSGKRQKDSHLQLSDDSTFGGFHLSQKARFRELKRIFTFHFYKYFSEQSYQELSRSP